MGVPLPACPFLVSVLSGFESPSNKFITGQGKRAGAALFCVLNKEISFEKNNIHRNDVYYVWLQGDTAPISTQ